MREEYLTVAEVAELCRVTPRMVQNWCKDGTLPATRMGRSYRVPRAEFDAWRAGRRVERPTIDVGRTFDVELGALVQAWLWEMEHGPRPYSKETVRIHRMHMHKYVRTLVSDDPARRLTFTEAVGVPALRLALARIPVAQFATRYNVFMAVMCFCNFLIRQGVIAPEAKEAMKALKPRRLVPPRREALHSLADVNRFIEAIWATEDYTTYEKTVNAAIVGTMVFAGLRVSEVANLELAHVDPANRLLTVHNGKGGKTRLVGINDRLAAMIAGYLKHRPGSDHPNLYLSTRGTPLCRDYIVRRIGRLAKRTGMRISAHGLRRTFATLNANAGRSLNLIQLALGHASITTTQQYLMADGRTAARAMQDW